MTLPASTTASYDMLKHRALAATFVLGPLVTLVSAGVFMLGIGRNPGMMGWGSSVEGVLGLFGFLLLIPPFVAMADELGLTMPRLALSSRVMVLLGFGGGAVWNMGWRVLIADEVSAGVPVSALDQLMANLEHGEASIGLYVITLVGVFTWMSSIAIGSGLLWKRRMRREGALLLLAGLLFPLGQLFLLGEAFYFAAIVLWAIALVPVGARRLSSLRAPTASAS